MEDVNICILITANHCHLPSNLSSGNLFDITQQIIFRHSRKKFKAVPWWPNTCFDTSTFMDTTTGSFLLIHTRKGVFPIGFGVLYPSKIIWYFTKKVFIQIFINL